MSYTKAREVLPSKLIEAIQKYIQGQNIYIPKQGRMPWGTRTKAKQRTLKRNKIIFKEYQAGVGVEKLSKRYFLSDKAVYKIIAAIKQKL